MNKIFLIVGFVAVFFLGLILGSNLNNKQEGTDLGNVNSPPKTCEYNGVTYESGEGFPDVDGCNNCSCENGQVACTLMACE